MYGDVNTDGFLNGVRTENYTVEQGRIIERFGSNGGGQYFSPVGEGYESKALGPFMDDAPYTKYEVLKPFNVDSGTIAPWWGRDGMGTQFYTGGYQIKALDGTYVDATVQNLLANKYIGVID